MVQSSGIKNVLSRFKRGSAIKTPGSKISSPSKLDAGNDPAEAPSPTKRLFSFSPAKIPNSARKTAGYTSRQESNTNDLIPASHGKPTAITTTEALSTGATTDDSNIKVVVRVRPRNDREASMGGAICVQPLDASSLRLTPPAEPHSFAFDHVANESATQQDIFNVAGKPIVDNCLQGFNGCLFAYGQTGSGKTYSMLGGGEEGLQAVVDDERRGLIQRIFEQIFAAAEAHAANGVQTKISCSFLEIYNESISDLLSPGSTQGLALREERRHGGGVFVEGLSEEQVGGVADVAAILQRGVLNRRVGETMMNERSSRSHSVFTATVERRTPGLNGSPDTVLRSRLHLVDLAGSERQKSTGAAGERLREASSINKSLSTLGLVIMSLVDQQNGRQRHVPYRDSKLTTLLRDSLGGNAKTVMVACISPAAVNAAETLGTLRFADGAKRIKNRAVVNEDAEGDAESLRKEVRKLKEELALALKGNAGGATIGSGENNMMTPVRGLKTSYQEDGTAHLIHPTTIGGGGGNEGARRALVGALRREEAAAAQVAGLQEELQGLRELVSAKDADLQRTQMMLKLKESRLARVAPSTDEVVATLTSEIEVLKTKLDAPHPEVKRFAVENLHLSQEVARLQSAINRHELETLGADVASLRRQLLGLAETAEVAEEEAERAKGEAEAARAALEGESRALKEVQAKLREQKEAAPVLQQRLAELEKENDELKLAAVDAVKLKQEADRLCAHAAGLESQCESLKAELQKATDEATELQAVYKSTTEELSNAWEQLEAAETAAKAAEDALQAAAKDAAQRREEHEASLSQAASSLEDSLRTVAELKKNLQASRTQAEELSAAVAAVTEERDRLVEEVVLKEKQLQEATESAASLKTQLSDKQEKLEKAETAVQQLQSEVESTAARAEQAEAALTKSQAQVTDLTSQLEIKTADLDSSKSRISALNIQVADLKDTVAKTTQELATEKSALKAATAEGEKLRSALSAALDSHENEIEQLQEEIRSIEAAKAELDFELSDKSASLTEVKEQLTLTRRALTQSKESEESSAAKIVELESELRAARQAGEQGDQEQVALNKKIVLLEEEVREAQAEAAAARVGPLEKEQQLLSVKAELSDTKARLEKARVEASALAASLRKRDEEVARVRAEMAAEVNDAAHQVQELLAAQARAEAAEERAAQLARKLRPSSMGGA